MKASKTVAAKAASGRSAGIRFAFRSPAPLYGVGRILSMSAAIEQNASIASLLLLAALVPLLAR